MSSQRELVRSNIYNSTSALRHKRSFEVIACVTRAIGIIVMLAQSEFNLVGSPLYGGRSQTPYRLAATGA
jgi:hypothetical protein